MELHRECFLFKMNKLKKIEEFFKEKDIQITMDYNFMDTGDLDSLAIVEFITFIEEEFDINFSQSELNHKNFGSIKFILSLINKKSN